MYFDFEKKELTKLHETKVKEMKEHNDRIHELEMKVNELKAASKNALESNDDELFVKLGGQIAVADAQTKREKESEKYIVPNELIQSMKHGINEKYEFEVGKRIARVFKLCDEIVKVTEEIGNVHDEMEEVANMYESITGKNEPGFHREDFGDIRNMTNYINSVIDPYCENGNSRSIRGYAFRLNYDSKK